MTRSALPRILLIGDQGQVAWELKRALATLGDVIVAGRTTPEISLDLSQPASLAEKIQALRPDWIINAAAYTAVDKAEQEPEMAMAVNGIAPGIIARSAKMVGALLVHYSTDYVFDGTASSPYTEESATNPQSVYGRTKLVGEQAVEEAGGEHLIFRTSWVYGARGHNFLRTVRRLAREREELRIVADQRGTPTWARNIAEATAQVLAKIGHDKEAWKAQTGIYNLTSRGETTWYDFASRIVEHQRAHETVSVHKITPITTEEYPLPAPRPAYSVLNNDKLLRTFGIALPDWTVALKHVQEELVLEKM